MNTIDVGKFICELRKEKGLTQKELAKNLNVTDKAVSKWETGKCYPDIEMLEKISTLFNVSINEILSGEKIQPEKIQEQADKNIIQVIKKSNKEKSKGQIIALILSIITFISGFYALYQSFTTKKNQHISIQTYSQNPTAVFNELSAAIYKEFQISTYTVCTDSHIVYDKDGNVTDIYMLLWDSHTFKEISVRYWLHDITGTPQTSITLSQKDFDLNIDGIHFNKYINLLSTENIGRVVELSGNTTDYGYSLHNDSYMWKTVEENDNYGILPYNYSFLYKDGDIIPFTNASQIEGKLFEIAVLINEVSENENQLQGSCALINIPR